MKKGTMKRLICLLSAAVMLLMAGCKNQDAKGDETNGSRRQESKAEGESRAEDQKGRYMETETDLSELLDIVSEMRKMPDGRLLITDRCQRMQASEDGGVTWKAHSHNWLEEKMETSYIMDVKMAPDGTLGIIYEDYEKSAGEEADGEETEDEEQFMFDLSPELALVTPDETVIPVSLSLTENDVYLAGLWVSDTGRFFVTTLGENIYEVKTDGSSELILTTMGTPRLIQFQENLMILDGYDFEVPLFYDLEKKAYVENQAVSEFVKENYGDRQFNGGSWYDLYLFPGKEGEIYLAGKKGLHCYREGEEAVEQLIDGKLSRLGNPQYGLKSMVFLETGEFLALSGVGKLVRFTYDPDAAAVPDEKLKIYSLKENYSIQVAASSYQIQNPSVYVEYEIGMGEGDAVTREDALKKLNTQIMAGEGPDILVMDGLPMDSYADKGLLCDLKGVIGSFGEEELFENLLPVLERDGKVYAVPGQVSFPVMLGREKYVANMKGLSAIADGIEQMRKDSPGADLIGLCSEKAIMRFFAVISAPEWKKENGEINREALEQFLTLTKRIYEAQMDGINEKSVERYKESSEYNAQIAGEKWIYDLAFYGGFSLDYVAGRCQILPGMNTYPNGYFDLTSVPKAEGCEDTILAPLDGQGRVFVPETILGINAASGKKELAEDFLKMFLGKENQVALGGYAVNKKALEELLVPEEEYLGENGEYGAMAIIDEDGLEYILNIFFPDSEELAVLWGWYESADIPYISDAVFEETVFEEGAKYILGQQSLEEALEAIVKQLAIYIAE